MEQRTSYDIYIVLTSYDIDQLREKKCVDVARVGRPNIIIFSNLRDCLNQLPSSKDYIILSMQSLHQIEDFQAIAVHTSNHEKVFIMKEIL
tara:strand:- start:3747 stop:4019 length:273 start_codon:yes stop_codon:yes gene_type:complete